MIRLYLEDIVGGAFEYLLSNTDELALSFEDIEKYGGTVVDELNKADNMACLELNQLQTDLFFREHQEAFKECIINGKSGITAVNRDIVNYIYEKIYGHISVNVLKALWSEEAVAKLTSCVNFDEKPFQLVRK